jgi:hypothetical protein
MESMSTIRFTRPSTSSSDSLILPSYTSVQVSHSMQQPKLCSQLNCRLCVHSDFAALCGLLELRGVSFGSICLVALVLVR